LSGRDTAFTRKNALVGNPPVCEAVLIIGIAPKCSSPDDSGAWDFAEITVKIFGGKVSSRVGGCGVSCLRLRLLASF